MLYTVVTILSSKSMTNGVLMKNGVINEKLDREFICTVSLSWSMKNGVINEKWSEKNGVINEKSMKNGVINEKWSDQ